MTPDPAPLDGAETTVIPLGSSGREFDLVLRGYDRGQVDHHIDVLEALLAGSEQAARDARAQSARLAEELAQARRTAVSEAPAAGFAALGKRVERILSLAEEQAADIRAQAHRDVAEAQEQAQRARAETEQARVQAEEEAERIRTGAQERVAQLLEEARQEAETILRGAREDVERLSADRDAIRTELGRLRERLAEIAGGA